MREALIVWGGWSGHEPEQCATIDRGHARRAKASRSASRTTTEGLRRPGDQGPQSLIVPIYTMSKIEKDEVLNLTRRGARAASGLAGYHGGMCDAFREAVDYQFMCGGQWVAHPGNIIDYHVDVDEAGRSDHAADPRVSPTAPSNTTCMSTRRTKCSRPRPSPASMPPWIEGVVMPVVWKRRHGKGRVFYSSLGHRRLGIRRAGDAGRSCTPRHAVGRAPRPAE